MLGVVSAALTRPVCTSQRCPAALVECGFISNSFESRLIANPEYRDRLGKAIAEGVMTYTKSRPRPPAESPTLAQARR